MNAIDLAVKGGAKVIATPGFLFEYPIMEAQTKYPDVSFILVDAEPKDKDGNVQIEDNVMSIMYAEEQAGYLAGYAAVTEGDVYKRQSQACGRWRYRPEHRWNGNIFTKPVLHKRSGRIL